MGRDGGGRAALFTALTRRRWGVAVMARLHEGRGGRVVALANGLGTSRVTVRATLRSLMEMGLVCANPGHGHPMRPEYILTPDGEEVGAACAAVIRALERVDASDIGLKRWALAVVWAMGLGAERFVDLRRGVPGVTDRSLSLVLRELQGVGLIERVEELRRGQTGRYRLGSGARGVIAALSRWGVMRREPGTP